MSGQDDRGAIADEISGIVVGQGYESTTIGISAALEAADALIAAGYRKQPEPEITDKLVAMVRDMVDPDDCWFDHNGGCQAHGYISLQHGELCPQAEAKAWLASLAVPVGAGEQG